MDKRSISYDRLDSLATSGSDQGISHLSQIVRNLKTRLESLEKAQTEMLDEINSLKKKANGSSIRDKPAAKPVKKRHTKSKYACTMCDAKFSNPKMLQKHRKEVHKAAYNI